MPPTNKNNVDLKNKFKVSFRSEKWREALVFLFFLIISAGFWLLQMLQQSMEINLNIPVIYANLPDNMVLSDTLPDHLKIKVQDKGTVLLNYFLSNKDKTFIVDLRKFTSSSRQAAVSAAYIESECENFLPATTKLLSYTPSSIPIYFNNLKTKKVPVILSGEILPSAGFMLTQQLQFTPSEVTVYGSETVLDTLEGIYTQKVIMKDLEESHTLKIKLAPPATVKTDVSTVSLAVIVEEHTEKIFDIPVIGRDFPEHYRLRTFPATVQITCLLPLSRYSEVKKTDFEAVVFYQDVAKDTTSRAPVTIIQKPEWISNYRFVPEKVEYLIERTKQ